MIFRQIRVGQGGREFGVFKFRTMVINADALLAELTARNETDGLMFKMRDDPRVTRVGQVPAQVVAGRAAAAGQRAASAT